MRRPDSMAWMIVICVAAALIVIAWLGGFHEPTMKEETRRLEMLASCLESCNKTELDFNDCRAICERMHGPLPNY
jgi:hypothetical protein